MDRDSSVNQTATDRLLDQFQQLNLLDRLRDNHRFSSAELAEVYTTLQQSRAEDVELGLQIKRLEGRRLRLRNADAQCRALLSPIRSLPDETLAEIFQWSRLSGMIVSSSSISTIDPRVEWVCAHWRKVAFQSTQIWSKWQFSIDGNPEDRLPHASHALQAHLKQILELSKDYPLDLRIEVANHPLDDPLVSLICDLSPRWEILDLEIQHSFPLELLTVAEGPLPTLSHARAILMIANDPWEFPELFRRAFKLKSLSLMRPNMTCTSIIHQIETLYAVGVDWALTAYLHRAVNVQSLTFTPCPVSFRRHSSPLEMVKLLRCKSITVKDWLPEYPAYLQNLSCPSLTRLTLKRCILWIPGGPDLTSFLQSCPSLTMLRLKSVLATSYQLMEMLSLLTSLVSLVLEEMPLDSPYNDGDYLQGLEPLEATDVIPHLSFNSYLLPSLRRLELSMCCARLSDEDINDMLISRAQEGLKSFKLHMLDWSFSYAKFEPLKDLYGMGFKASISATGCDEFCTCMRLWSPR